MNRKLFLLVVASFAVLVLLFGYSKKDAPAPVVVPPITLKATAIIDAGIVQQTTQGFGGNSILAWITDLTSDQRIKAFSLDTTQYAAYAAHLKAYNTAVGGVYAISPWNEPNLPASGWMKGTAMEVANFVAKQGANCGAPIMGPEPFNDVNKKTKSVSIC